MLTAHNAPSRRCEYAKFSHSADGCAPRRRQPHGADLRSRGEFVVATARPPMKRLRRRFRWTRTDPVATSAPRRRTSPQAMTTNTTKHMTHSPSRWLKPVLHIVSMPRRRTWTEAGTTATTRLTISEAEL